MPFVGKNKHIQMSDTTQSNLPARLQHAARIGHRIAIVRSLTLEDIQSRAKQGHLADSRQIVALALYKSQHLSYQDLGAILKRSREAAHYLVTTAQNRIQTDPPFLHAYTDTLAQLALKQAA